MVISKIAFGLCLLGIAAYYWEYKNRLFHADVAQTEIEKYSLHVAASISDAKMVVLAFAALHFASTIWA